MKLSKVKEIYKTTTIVTASTIKFKILLLEKCLEYVKNGIQAIQMGDIAISHDYLTRTQQLLTEGISLISLETESGLGIIALYEYMNKQLIEANIERDPNILQEVVTILEELLNAWREAYVIRNNKI